MQGLGPEVKPQPARIEYLRVENFRALRKVELKEITPLTVLVGPNGSGKSTLFDVFGFLSDCFQSGLRKAWDKRGRGREIRSRGGQGPLVIELKYRERKDLPLITYHIAIDEKDGFPIVAEEWLQWKRGSHGRPFKFLEYAEGKGKAISGEAPDESDTRIDIPLRSPDLFAVSTLGQFAEHPRVAALREFIAGWYVSYLSVSDARKISEAGPQERLSKTGDNLANVVQHLLERHPERLKRIISILQQRVPRLENVDMEMMQNGQLLLKIKDAPFEDPILAHFASDGTMKLLAYLLVLHDPTPPPFIGIEEPENFLHPRLLSELAEECREAAARSQVLVTTHSPFFLDGVRAEETRVLYRDASGYTQVERASDILGVNEFMAAGASLGHLWLEGHFGMGDPLVNQGAPSGKGRA